MEKPVNRLVKTMSDKGLRLALAESMTCGLLAHQLSTVKGTSQVLLGSIVCYDEKVKCGLLKIPEKLLKKYTAESQEVTDQLARNLRKLMKADIYAAITGLASDGGSETVSKPVGTVFMSVIRNGKLVSKRKRFRGSPIQIKRKACKALYDLILSRIDQRY